MAVLITGAASGIGRHLVGAFARRGERVVATDLEGLRVTSVGIADGWPRDVVTAALDVRSPEAWSRVWDEAEAVLAAAQPAGGQRIDTLLNVAGFLAPDWVEAVRDDDVERHLDVNVKGVVYGTREAARRMIGRGGGQVVNVGSLASLSPVPGLSLYAASKFAVRGFSLSAALELADKGVHVSLVMPDAVQTPMLDLQRPRPEAALTFSGGRVLTPADVEAAILEVLRTRALELAIPRSRGVLARAASLMPELGRRLLPTMRALGRKRQ